MQNAHSLTTSLNVQTDLLVPARALTSGAPNRFKQLKHLSTDLLRDEKVRDDYLTPEVEFLGYEAIKRVCYTCFDEDA